MKLTNKQRKLHDGCKTNVAEGLIFALLPVFCAFFWCLLDGKGLWQVYLPLSTWNDELFYYKLTEGVVNFGYPRGFFGFNESHGMYLSFAAWSPVLLLFWIVWGAIFGWNLLSPILCNIAILLAAMLLFWKLTKMTRGQMVSLGLLYITFMPITRFALSCIPEVQLFSLFILYLGITISMEDRYASWKMGVLFGLVMVLTWMRPYLILLFMTPIWLWILEEKKKVATKKSRYAVKGLVVVGIIGATLLVYWAVNHYFSAPYLTDLFYTDWVKAYFERGILGGLKYTAWKLVTSMMSVCSLMWQNLSVSSGLGSAAGLYYFAFLLMLLFYLVEFVQDVCVWRSARKKVNDRDSFEAELENREDIASLPRQERCIKILLEAQMVLCMVGFFVADLLMYRIQEGGRHCLVYLVGGLFFMPFACNHKGSGIFAVIFAGLFMLRGNIPYEFQVPYIQPEYASGLENLSAQLVADMELSVDAPNYENTVIWTLWDSVDGETETVDFGSYYAVPKGFGINLCDGGYVDANLEKLQSRYIGVLSGGDLEKRCEQAGYTVVGRNGQLVVYDSGSRQ